MRSPTKARRATRRRRARCAGTVRSKAGPHGVDRRVGCSSLYSFRDRYQMGGIGRTSLRAALLLVHIRRRRADTALTDAAEVVGRSRQAKAIAERSALIFRVRQSPALKLRHHLGCEIHPVV